MAILCPECGMSGRGTEEFPMLCPMCSMKLSEKKFMQNVVGKRYNEAHFSDYKKGNIFEINIKADKGFFLSGSVGCGKTHFLACLVRALSCKGLPFIYTTYNDMVLKLRIEAGSGKNDLLNTYKEIDFLLIDDFGTTNETEFTYATVYNILNYRYSDMKHTSISTNLREDQIDDRLMRRFKESFIAVSEDSLERS